MSNRSSLPHFLIITVLILLLMACGSSDDEITSSISDIHSSAATDTVPSPHPQFTQKDIIDNHPIPTEAGKSDRTMLFGQSQCEEKYPVRLTAVPASPDDLSHIFPMGLMSGSHVTPVDHQYYYWGELQVPPERYPVYAPADGHVVNVSFLNNDYIVFIEHSCDVYTEFIHLQKLVGPLADIEGTVSWNKPVYVRIPVKAGEMISLDGGTNGFDFSVHDYSVTLEGFINPESYVAEPWKTHTVDPYDYFDELVRSQLLAKNVRQVEPLGGRIDYDIPGRLIGNWFVEGTNGYAGLGQSSEPIKPDQQIGYWNTHLAIAHDPIDPFAIIVSMGSFAGETAQFLVADPDPLPKNVSVETGLVKYALMDWGYVYGPDDEPWHGIIREAANDIRVRPGEGIRGVVLFQMLDEGHLEMEAFPGAGLNEVQSFTDGAKIYER